MLALYAAYMADILPPLRSNSFPRPYLVDQTPSSSNAFRMTKSECTLNSPFVLLNPHISILDLPPPIGPPLPHSVPRADHQQKKKHRNDQPSAAIPKWASSSNADVDADVGSHIV